MPGFVERMRSSFNVLMGTQPQIPQQNMVVSQMYGGSVAQIHRDTSSAVMTPIINRLSIDAAAIPIRHVSLSEQGSFKALRASELNERLTVQANIDQTGRDFIRDAVVTMLEEGVCALVPIDTSSDPENENVYDILSIRVGSIVEWFNKSVRVEVYNDATGEREEITLPKSYVAIAYNPMFEVMNQANSTLKRLIDKLALADSTDNRLGSPNLDLILQLPYTVRTDERKNQAMERRKMMEDQLYDSTYGVAYIDAAEKITQLNRPVANSLQTAVDSLTESLHNQLGLTQSVFAGTASSEEMVRYYNRTIDPILSSLTDSMIKTFLTKTARSQGQSIKVIPNLFKMAPIEILAEAVDKLTRNEIMSSNEVRAELGLAPVNTKAASELRNKNINDANASPDDREEKSEEELAKELELDG